MAYLMLVNRAKDPSNFKVARLVPLNINTFINVSVCRLIPLKKKLKMSNFHFFFSY